MRRPQQKIKALKLNELIALHLRRGWKKKVPPWNSWVRRDRAKGVAHPAPNLLRDMWTNTNPENRGRQDAGQEYSESGGEVQGFCVRAGALGGRGARAGAGGGGAAASASSGSLFGVRGMRARLRSVVRARV